MVTLSDFLVFIASRFPYDQYNDDAKREGVATKELKQLKHLSSNIKKAASNLANSEE